MPPHAVPRRRNTRHDVANEFRRQLHGSRGQRHRCHEIIEIAGTLGRRAVGPGKHAVVDDFDVDPEFVPVPVEMGFHFAMADPIAERVRKIGGSTLRSIGHIARTQRVMDNDARYVEPLDMLAELRADNQELAARLREAHGLCDEHRDVATASLIEVWIDETERRTWFLFEAGRKAGEAGR